MQPADDRVWTGDFSQAIEAERHDALGDPGAALAAVEQALRRAQGHQRPWHWALATERAGRLYMRQGLADPALLNLLDNAHKYGPPASPIAVRVTTDDGRAVLGIVNDCASDLGCDAAELLDKAVRGSNSRGIPGLGMEL